MLYCKRQSIPPLNEEKQDNDTYDDGKQVQNHSRVSAVISFPNITDISIESFHFENVNWTCTDYQIAAVHKVCLKLWPWYKQIPK